MSHRIYTHRRSAHNLIALAVIALLLAGLVPVARAQDGGDSPVTQTHTLGRGLVRSVAWSPNGDIVAVGGALGIWLYTPELEDRPINLLRGHTKAVYDIAFSPDSSKIATVSHDMTVRTWDVSDGDPLHVLEGHADLIVAVDWHPTQDVIASGAYDGTVRLWNPITGQEVNVLEGHSDWVSDVIFSPDGALVASSSYDGTVRVWRVDDGATVAVLEAHSGPVAALDWPSEGTLVSAGWDGTVRRWRAADGRAGPVLYNAHDDVIYDVAWSPQGDTLVTASWDGTLRNWFAQGLTLAGEYIGHTGRVQRVVWNPAGTQVATLGWDDTVRVWDVTQGEQVAVRHEHMDFIVWLGWTGGELRALTLDGRLLVWDTENGSLLGATDGVSADGLPALRTHPRGMTYDIDEGGVVRLMQSQGEDAVLLGTLPGRANAATWSPDGTQIAVAARNGTITIWKVE